MFQTFTGSSRRPRQVNLSGRNNNPFAAVQQTTSSGPSSQSSAVQLAQQERKARQLERDRLQASKIIQKAWKGHVARETRRREQRLQWDRLMKQDDPDLQEAIHLLLQFARPRQEASDLDRILHTCQVFFSHKLDAHRGRSACPIDMAHFGAELAEVLDIMVERDTFEHTQTILSALISISAAWPEQLVVHFLKIFKTVTHLLTSSARDSILSGSYDLITTLLQNSGQQILLAHKGFVMMLEYDWLREVLDLGQLATAVNPGALASALQNYLETWKPKTSASASCMLAQYIFIYRNAEELSAHQQRLELDNKLSENVALDIQISTKAIAHISSLTKLMSLMSRDERDDSRVDRTEPSQQFIRDQLETLVDQETITSLLAHFESSGSDRTQSEFASTLSSYVLTLIQLFPRRSDEIRMWIYMGSANASKGEHTERLPAIKFFWEAVEQTDVFKRISQNSLNVVEFTSQQKRSLQPKEAQISHQQEWKTCLLFLELYMFVLKIMDDDEFMSAGAWNSGYQSWTRQSSLSLESVRKLTVFLKNLAFAMYWYATDITTGDRVSQSSSLGQYFNNTDSSKAVLSKARSPDTLVIDGLQSSSISYIKGTATGLLRMLYERDSRRNFCPEGFWLMPAVDMAGFIQAVLEEQKHKDEHDENEDSEDEEDLMEVDDDLNERDLRSLVGAQRTQYLHRIEQIRRQQQRMIKRRRLEDSLPRLNILENMPFFIPFHTRVKIFRELVNADKLSIRQGQDDAIRRRMSGWGRHEVDLDGFQAPARSAKVRRGHVMDDAFEQLYTAGEGLKLPLHITFVDQFDAPEAGIDGGGVTKEFLTSITEEAFKKGELKLFKENSQHLLYPNPVLIEEEKAMLLQEGYSETDKQWQARTRDILLRYEFIGRIVGKCLYEGILIDIHFAPFFLVKWALTGGRGSATNESSYRATINDLKALDEELYKGLLDLKNYPGNAEDFSLDFTITDEISTEDEPLGSIKVTKELRPDGANIPVTSENKLVYISYVARHRLQLQPQQQTNAFLRGIGSMIQPSWLSMFNQSELQTLIGGDSSEIDVADLRRNTVYGGVYEIGDDGQEHDTVKLFWEVVQGLSDSDRRKFLKYVTSTPRAPLLGFSQLRPLFSIRDSGSDQQRLPSTSTCVNLLKLPIYKNKTLLREKLLYAITSGAGFDLS